MGGTVERVEISDVWGDAWAGDLSKGSWVTVYYQPDDPRRMASPDGLSTLSPNSESYHIGLVAAVVLIVSVGGRADTAYREWTRPVRVRRPRVRNRRRHMVRRNDWASRMILGFGLIGTVLSVLTDDPLITTVGLSPLVVGGYIMGVSRGVVVTPEELLVHNAFSVIRIPRRLVTGLVAKDDGFVGIEVAGGRAVEVGVSVSRAFEGGGNFDRTRAQARTLKRLEAVMAEIPAVAGNAVAGTRRRWLTMVVAAVSFSCLAWLAFEAVANRVS